MGKILGTFRIESETWNAFKEWANSQNSNASTELNRFVLSCLGRIDSVKSCDSYLEQNLDNRIDTKLKQLIPPEALVALGEKSLA
jgi:hypothetical protein